MTIATTESTSLALDHQQATWTDRQRSALTHIGVDKANEGDLEVFFHVCKRTGLDPFARQIYMIGRQSSENVGGEWVKVTKQTIQTGIDGFRLIGRRAADRAHQSISMDAPEWAHEDGSWRPVWRASWGVPVAARVTIKRNGEPFTGVALFDEYAQTKRNGDLTQMWAQRPAGQVAKCAEALAWRMAFPQDLSGIYTDDEMAQAENTTSAPAEPRSGGLAAALANTAEVDADQIQEAEIVPEPEGITSAQLKKIGAAMRDLGITERANALVYVNDCIGREVSSRNELTKDEASRVIESLERDLTPVNDAQGGEQA